MKKLLLLMMCFVACDVDTDSISLESVYFTAIVYGNYQLTETGATCLNTSDNYFSSTPSTLFSDSTVFSIDSYGNLSLFLDEDIFILEFLYSLYSDSNSAVYEVSYPEVSNSGALIENDRYIKIYADSQTNLYLFTPATTSNLAELSTDSYEFATRSYVND